ncbi:MAG TPA: site-specific integrase [Methylocystis sp.]|jgi:hypothetical protein
MSALVLVLADRTPALIAAVGARASYRFFEFFTANIRNPHTRRAYARAALEFFDWLEARGVTHIAAVESVHVAAYVEQLRKARSRADREAALGGVAAFVRLAGDRPDHAGQSSGRRARAASYRAARQDAGARNPKADFLFRRTIRTTNIIQFRSPNRRAGKRQPWTDATYRRP